MYTITAAERDVFNARFGTNWTTSVSLTELLSVDQSELARACMGNYGVKLRTKFPLPDLRVYKFMPRQLDPATQDFSILPLTKEPPVYSKGLKAHARYLDPATSNPVIKKTFEDTDTRQIKRTFEWYNNDGTVGLTKVETQEFARHTWANMMKERRSKQVLFLLDRAKDFAFTDADKLHDYFKTYTDEYIQRGGSVLLDQIRFESDSSNTGIDPDINAILNQSENGDLIANHIIHQIT